MERAKHTTSMKAKGSRRKKTQNGKKKEASKKK
jgi:hypothetical protein